MLDSIRLRCPKCDHVFHQSVAYVTGQIKAMKIHKRDEVAQQMADKRGPFYDKWVAAMEARGEPKRCKDCLWLYEHIGNPRYINSSCYIAEHEEGHYACRQFEAKPQTDPDALPF